MKITVITKPNSDHMLAVCALMAESKLKETQRVVVGGDNTDVKLVLTFEGNDDHYRLFYNSSYVEVPFNNTDSNFYSLACLGGKLCRNLGDFKIHLKQNTGTKIIIKKL